jgi:hypothetical protein
MTIDKNLTNLTAKKEIKSAHISARLPIHLFNKIERKAYQNNTTTSIALRQLLERL